MLLTLNLRYGSAFGFTDLTSPAFSWLLHGPATTGETAPVLFDLAGLHTFPADPSQGGRIVGTLSFSASQTADLLAGLDCINIYTPANLGGELRGQLVVVAEPGPAALLLGAGSLLCAGRFIRGGRPLSRPRCFAFTLTRKGRPDSILPSMARTDAQSFATTRWDVLFAAADTQNPGAREEFARLYWLPLYAYARRKGRSPHDAEESVQSFLSRLLSSGALARLTREGGRLRDFLRISFERHLISEHRAAVAAWRRPPEGYVFLDGLDPEARLALEPADGLSPDGLFDRLCARTLLDAAHERVLNGYRTPRERELFEHLFAFLNSDPQRASHAEAAARFGLSEGGLKNRLTRLRREFRDSFRQQVAATLTDLSGDRVDDEIRCLVQSLQA